MRTSAVTTRRADLLDNPIRPNAWGSETEIPRLLGVEPTGQPQAELWMGAHPATPSRLRGGGTLIDRIEADPTAELSAVVVRHFGARLPFLMKVIAAERPLSLQAHPNLEQARAGFAAEQQRGVPLDSPERSYVDANHKPELVYALTPIETDAGPYRSGQIWAEPDVEHAAWYMTRLAADASLRESVGRVAAAHLSTHFSCRVAGERMRERLRVIGRMCPSAGISTIHRDTLSGGALRP